MIGLVTSVILDVNSVLIEPSKLNRLPEIFSDVNEVSSPSAVNPYLYASAVLIPVVVTPTGALIENVVVDPMDVTTWSWLYDDAEPDTLTILILLPTDKP